MMRLILVVLACLCMAPQAAPPAQIEWYGNFDDALEAARLRNAMILLAFHQDNDRKCELQRRGSFVSAPFVKMAREELICVIAHLGAKKGEAHSPEQVQDPRTGALVTRCPVYKTITCTEHEALWRSLRSTYDFKEPPATFLLDPDGEILAGPTGIPPIGNLAIRKIKEIQKKELEGKTLTYSRYRKIRKKMDDAEAQLSEDKYLYAIAGYQKVLKDKRLTDPLREKVSKALTDINGIGLALIEKGKQVYPEDPEKGMKLLKTVRYDFKGLEAADKAREAIAAIEEAGK
jgi:hypothetical protein